MIDRRGDLDDPVVLDVEIEVATHPAERADRASDALAFFFPHLGLSQLVFRSEHQCSGWTHPDAVAAEDTGTLGQVNVELGRDPGVESPPGNGNSEGVLGIFATGFDALVAENALGVITHIEGVIDLHRLMNSLGDSPVDLGMMPRMTVVAIGDLSLRRSEPLGPGGVPVNPSADLGTGQREVSRRRQKLEHHLS